jgi:hypothetical protein
LHPTFLDGCSGRSRPVYLSFKAYGFRLDPGCRRRFLSAGTVPGLVGTLPKTVSGSRLPLTPPERSSAYKMRPSRAGNHRLCGSKRPLPSPKPIGKCEVISHSFLMDFGDGKSRIDPPNMRFPGHPGPDLQIRSGGDLWPQPGRCFALSFFSFWGSGADRKSSIFGVLPNPQTSTMPGRHPDPPKI